MDMKKWRSWIKVAVLISIAYVIGYYGGYTITEWFLN